MEDGLGGSGGDFAVADDSGGVGGSIEPFLDSLSSSTGDSGVGCIRKGFNELALGVIGDVETAPLLVEAMLGADGGNRRFFFDAASRRLTLLGPSRRSTEIPLLGAFKKGLGGCAGTGIVMTKGCVCK